MSETRERNEETMHDGSPADGGEAGPAFPKDGASAARGPARAIRRPKRIIALGIAAMVLIAVGSGFWIWHEQPSFCNAFCHTPMDPYLPTFEATPGEAALDKWGHEVSDASAMMAPLHRMSVEEGGSGATCVSCHVPTVPEQLSEVASWATGSYLDPIDERNSGQLLAARGLESDAFCLNESCHDLTREQLATSTEQLGERNPHEGHHGDEACDSCHKGHRASVNQCTECHLDAPVPEGWLTHAEEHDLLR